MDNQNRPATSPRLSYHGKLRTLYQIWLVNLLLQIITLGIYRFWAKTKIRKYLWSHITLDHSPFEYTGTGGELFRGFLTAIVLLIVPLVLIRALSVLPPSIAIAGLIMIMLFFGVLSNAALFSALRYRLSRTNWRGIRGGLEGSMWRYGIVALRCQLLVGLSLSLLVPWSRQFLARYLIERASFGNARAQLSTIKLYVWCYIMGLGTIFIAVILSLGILFFSLGGSEGLLLLGAKLQTQDQQTLQFFTIGMWGWAFAIGLIGALAMIPFLTAQMRAIVDHTTLGPLAFKLQLRKRDYLRIILLPRLLSTVTIGIASPLMWHWQCRFFAKKLELMGEIETAQLLQSEHLKPGRGEGLLEVMDINLAF